MTDPVLRPIGSFVAPEEWTTDWRTQQIQRIAQFPETLSALLAALKPEDWHRTYRPGSWTVQQIVHHLGDSHLNAYQRFKLALTETEPHICPYDENRWAELPDVYALDPAVSLQLLHALHLRWVATAKTLSPSDWERNFYHPGYERYFSLQYQMGMYAWHGEHHLAQIRNALKP